MLPNVDPVILEALGLEATSSKMMSHGGSSFASSFKLVSTKDGQELVYFVKTGSGSSADVMFQGQEADLAVILALCSPSLQESTPH